MKQHKTEEKEKEEKREEDIQFSKKTKSAQGHTSGSPGARGGSRQGNAGHESEQYGSQGNR